MMPADVCTPYMRLFAVMIFSTFVFSSTAAPLLQAACTQEWQANLVLMLPSVDSGHQSCPAEFATATNFLGEALVVVEAFGSEFSEVGVCVEFADVAAGFTSGGAGYLSSVNE